MAGGTRALVLTDPRLLVRLGNERLVMLREGNTVAAIPLVDVSHVAVHGPVTLTGAALAAVLDAGIDLSYYTSTGRYRGTASAARSGNVYLLLAQAAAWNDVPRCVELIRVLVGSKMSGQRQILQRAATERASVRCAEAADALRAMQDRLHREQDPDVLRGIEGAAAAVYFGVFGELLRPPWTFTGRVRRPPTDPVNALLSFGYTLVTGELVRLLQWGGFDTRIGFLHALRYGRESLALDLLEELRAPLVDRFTLRILNRRQLSPDDFERDGEACRLTPSGRARYLEAWEEMLAAHAATTGSDDPPPPDVSPAQRVGTDEAPPEETTNWRFRMERQVHRLQRFLLRGTPYEPLNRVRPAPRPGTPGAGGRLPAPNTRPGSSSPSTKRSAEEDPDPTSL